LAVIFLFIAALSQFMSDATGPLGWDILDKLWKIVLLNILITSFMRSRVRLYSLVLVICITFGYEAAGDGLKFLASGGFYSTLGNPVIGDNNYVALTTLMIIPLLGYIREEAARPLVRLGALAGIVLFVCSVISTRSRGGFLGLLVLVVAGILVSRHRMRYFLAVAALGVVLSQVIPEQWTAKMNTIQMADQDNSFMGRVVAWKMGTLIALDRPLLGGGLHSLQSQNIWSAYRPNFDELSFIPTDFPVPEAHAAHSIYFEVLGDTGFLGLAVFLGIVASSFRNARQIQSLARGHADLEWAARLATKLQLSLIVLLVAGAALSATYDDLNYIVFAMLSAARATVREQLAQRVSAPSTRQGNAAPVFPARPPGQQPTLLAGSPAIRKRGQAG
jgi:probable O-glycosylation ligase (exosortase A-associated)